MKFRLFPFVATVTTGIWFTCFFLPACNKSNNTGNSKIDTAASTITTILKSSTIATYFYYAMTRTHLDSLFNTKGVLPWEFFTVFVPTDSAFEASGITRSSLNSMTDSALKRIVLYQTVQRNLLSSDVTNSNFPLQTVDSETVFLTNDPNGFYINGIPVSQKDIVTKNGVIQFIRNSVALPPLGNVYQILHSDTSFSYLITAMNRVNSFVVTIGQPQFTQLLIQNPTTIFAPNNHALQINGYPDTASINAANPDSLLLLLYNHIVPYRLFTSDILNGQKRITTLESTISFSSSGSTIKVTGNSNNVPANILKANIMATNGVFYTIDQTLKP